MLSLTKTKYFLKLEEGGLPCLIDLWAQTDLSDQTRSGRNSSEEQFDVVKKQRRTGQMVSADCWESASEHLKLLGG